MGANRPIWSIPGITQRLIELHALGGADHMTMGQIAEKLSAEFKVELTKNSVIGRSHRLKLELRDNVPFVRRKATPMPKRKYRVDAPIPPLEAERLPEINVLTIYQLTHGDCHWPLGEMLDYPPFLYCGQVAIEGRPYCAAHCRKAYNAPNMRWE